MELIALFDVMKRRWWLILIPALVALVLSLSSLRAAITPSSSYSLAIRFTASAKPNGTGTFQDQSYTPWLASEYAVNSIASWMRTESFAKELAKELASTGVSVSEDSLRGVIASDSARSLMTFIVTTWPNSDELRAIGAAAVKVLSTQTDTYFPQLAAQKTAIVPLDEALAAPIAVPLTARLAPLGRIGIGLLLGVVLAFAAEYLDDSLRNRREVEALGLKVIGEIPRHGTG